MMDRLTICAEICRRVRISRDNPHRTSLSKREIVAVWRRLIHLDMEVERLKTELTLAQRTSTPESV